MASLDMRDNSTQWPQGEHVLVSMSSNSSWHSCSSFYVLHIQHALFKGTYVCGQIRALGEPWKGKRSSTDISLGVAMRGLADQ